MQLHIAHRAATASPVPPQQQQPVGVPPPASLAGGSPQSATPSSVTTRRVGYKDLFGIVARICPARKADLEAFGLKLARAEREGTHTPDMLFRHAQQHTQELCGQEVAAKAISYLQQVVQLGKHRSSSSSPAPQQQQQAQHAQQQAAAQQHAQQQPQAHNQAGGLFNQHLRAPSPVSQTMQQQQVQMATRPQPVPQQQMQFQQQQQQQKRPADSPADERDAKKAKAAGGTAAAKKKEDNKKEDVDQELNADAFVDIEGETDALMIDIQRRRDAKQVAPASSVQYLSEWRVGNEIYRQVLKQGLKGVDPKCFEVVQLAWQAHATNLLQAAQRSARHRQDACRRAQDAQVTSDVRRPLGQIAKRDQEKYEAKLAAEREALLKMAGSKKADEETRERAQKAKAEMQASWWCSMGRKQASAANAAVAATLGGKGAKWDKWGAGGGGAGAAAGGGGGGAKKGKKAAEARLEAAEAAARAEQEGHATTTLDAPAAEAAKAGPAPAQQGATAAAARQGVLQTSRPRAGKLLGSEDGGETITTRDIIAAMERDPVYCHSSLLFSLLNGAAITS